MGFTLRDDLLKQGECSFAIAKVSTEHCSPRKQAVDCIRPSYALHFVVFGRGTLRTGDGRVYPLKRGDAFLLYKNAQYSYAPDPKDPWSYTWVEVDGENLDELFSLCGFSPESCCRQVVDFDGFLALMKEMQNAYDARRTQQIRCAAYFMLLCSKFIENRLAEQPKGKDSRKMRLVRDVLIYINNNCLGEQLSTPAIAKENGISVATLLRLFDEYLGMSPVEYINAYRVSRACELMQSTETNASEAARMAGFEDEKYFSRVFKKIKGMTPMEYRRSGTDEDPFLWIKEKQMLFR